MWFLSLGIICILYFVAVTSYVGMASKFHCIWLVAGMVCLSAFAYIRWAQKHSYHMPEKLKNLCALVVTIGTVIFVILQVCIISGACSKPQGNADYVIVLGAQVRGKVMSLTLQRRVDKALAYLKENENSKAVLSGGKGAGEEISEAQAMYEYLIANGIAKDRLILEDTSTTTAENLANSMECIEADGGNGKEVSVVISTTEFHMFRALRMAKKQGFTQVSGLTSQSKALLVPTYFTREALAIVKALILFKL